MWEWLSHPTAQVLLALAVLFVAVFIGFQVIKSLRPVIGEDPATSKYDTNADDPAQNFDEMLSQGDISEAELRRIKTVLGKSQDTRGK